MRLPVGLVGPESGGSVQSECIHIFYGQHAETKALIHPFPQTKKYHTKCRLLIYHSNTNLCVGNCEIDVKVEWCAHDRRCCCISTRAWKARWFRSFFALLAFCTPPGLSPGPATSQLSTVNHECKHHRKLRPLLMTQYDSYNSIWLIWLTLTHLYLYLIGH